MSDKK
jgi:small subunit ribosomal protein S16e